ncbi:hypothetical protein ACIRPH_31700 [Nocardiopsis sp. NPDC101807]
MIGILLGALAASVTVAVSVLLVRATGGRTLMTSDRPLTRARR